MENQHSTVNIGGTDYEIESLSPETRGLIGRYAEIQAGIANMSVQLREQSMLLQGYANDIEASVQEQD